MSAPSNWVKTAALAFEQQLVYLNIRAGREDADEPPSWDEIQASAAVPASDNEHVPEGPTRTLMYRSRFRSYSTFVCIVTKNDAPDVPLVYALYAREINEECALVNEFKMDSLLSRICAIARVNSPPLLVAFVRAAYARGLRFNIDSFNYVCFGILDKSETPTLSAFLSLLGDEEEDGGLQCLNHAMLAQVPSFVGYAVLHWQTSTIRYYCVRERSRQARIVYLRPRCAQAIACEIRARRFCV